MDRRSFLTGLISFVAAPAIVRAGSLMPVKALPVNFDAFIFNAEWVEISLGYAITRKAIDENLYNNTFGLTMKGYDQFGNDVVEVY